MATFDFDHAPERLGTRCVKWDSIGEGELPMWVADMDFEVAPAIRQAVERRAAHPVYGYTFTPSSTGLPAATSGTSTVAGYSIPPVWWQL